MIWAPPALNSSQCIGNSISTSQCCLFLAPAAPALTLAHCRPLQSPDTCAHLSQPLPGSSAPSGSMVPGGLFPVSLVQPQLPKGDPKPSLRTEDLLGDRKRLGSSSRASHPAAFGPCPQLPPPSDKSRSSPKLILFFLCFSPDRKSTRLNSSHT